MEKKITNETWRELFNIVKDDKDFVPDDAEYISTLTEKEGRDLLYVFNHDYEQGKYNIRNGYKDKLQELADDDRIRKH